MDQPFASCAGPACRQFLQAESLADLLNWQELEEEWYCSLCGPVQAYRMRREARKEEMRRQVDHIQSEANKETAKRHLSGADYRAWDEFQSDLANFHRETGNLAHRELRLMSPGTFIKSHRDLGRIDIAATTENMDAAEKAAKRRSMDAVVRQVENLKGI